ncbi:MAG: carbohydrate kinase family protein [Candidatus Thorarchaeota archaeon]
MEVAAIGRINIDIMMHVEKLPRRKDHLVSQDTKISFGGSAANFALQSARLGVKSGLIGCVGDDLYGQKVMKNLNNLGVDTRAILVLGNQPTGLFFLAQDPQGESVVFTEPGANRFLEKHIIEDEYLIKARTIHVAGGFPMITSQVADMATADGMIFSLDPGRAADGIDYSNIIRRTDLLFMTQKELKKYFKIESSEKALKTFAKTFPGVLVIKIGEKGAIATDGFEFCSSKVFEVPVLDTLGAGDAFAAGFVTAWTRSERIEQALNVANAVAALTITKKGAQEGQPSLEKTASLLSKHGISIDPILRTFRKGKRRKSKRRSG